MALAMAMAVVLSGVAVTGVAPAQAATSTGSVVEQELRVPVRAEPDGSAVTLDVTLYRPESGPPAPALVLAHGFGGSKADSVQRARELAGSGYVVLAYSARGFAGSGGRIHLDDPDYEVADARALVDLLGGRAEVRSDAAGDPRVAVVGASYGGALALMLGATDPRVDAVVAVVTWHDLADAFFPQHAVSATFPGTPADVTGVGGPGPFKQLWAARFFASAATAAPPSGPSGADDPVCGRFDPTVCRLFRTAAETGEPSPDLLAMLHAHSPKALLAGLRAPTLLVQGMRDTLFGLEHADATARALAGRVPVLAVRWIDGGHDGASSTADDDEQALRDFLRATLTGTPTVGAPTAPDASGATSSSTGFVWAAAMSRRQTRAPLLRTESYAAGPGLTWAALPMLDAGPQRLLTPPGGQPGSVTALPGAGLGNVGGTAAYQLAALPGQSAAFDSAPLTERRDIVGAPRVRLRVTSSAAEVSFFVSLWQVTGGIPTLSRRLVAPVRAAVTPGRPTDLDIALPPATWTAEAGSTLRVLVTTTDSGYAPPRHARVDAVALAEPVLQVPLLPGTVVAADSELDRESIGVAIALLVLLGAAVALAGWRRRRAHPPHRLDLAEVPLVVESLVKTYADGHRAVDDVSWRAERGQVVGLLGPNGAGKTTTLRMALGLIHPDSGTTYLSGEPVLPGSAALRHVGALVEGPGFLPHLTGRDNLLAYWAATGRDLTEAHLDEAIEVAALGGAIERPVRSYSHGMKQRLGIAQAMLGLPDLLVLDEPTNGLDPPQIAAMRQILKGYAAAGRTVVVSSHLLAEVEQTCSHVVVMHAGRVLRTGRVADLVDSRHHLEEVFLGVIAAARDDSAHGDSAHGDSAHGDSAHGDSAHGPGHPAEGAAGEVDAMTERLRQVRAR